MTPQEIVQAFGQRLAAMPQVPPIVWEDQDASPARPCLSVQHVPVTRETPGIAGGASYVTGYFAVTVMAARGGLAQDANAIATAILAHFPKALALGRMRITQARIGAPGFIDGADYRLPVRIDYIAT